jgi:hypothetical protein
MPSSLVRLLQEREPVAGILFGNDGRSYEYNPSASEEEYQDPYENYPTPGDETENDKDEGESNFDWSILMPLIYICILLIICMFLTIIWIKIRHWVKGCLEAKK